MLQLVTIAMATTLVLAGPDAREFQLQTSETRPGTPAAKGAKNAKIVPTRTDAAMRFFVVDKETGPVKGVVICLDSPAGIRRCTEETDGEGYAEVLVPAGQKYEVTYLSLGRKEIAANVNVTGEPNQNVKLTLRYKRRPPPPPFVLTGIVFDTGKATIRPESFPRLDVVVEFMRLRKSARLEISGHTDNVGSRKANKTLSAKRAEACRSYLVSKGGIDGTRIIAIGHGDEKPIVPNDSDENRQKNRRIEVVEVQAEGAPRPL